MWSVSHLCRCTTSLRAAQSRLGVSSRNGIISNARSRQLITPAKYSNRLSNLIKSNGIVIRLCSSAPKPKSSKAVGYWLLGCSGMVFTAVVLGMVLGYVILLYSVYYVVNIVVKTTNGTK